MALSKNTAPALTSAQVEQFVQDGFVRIDNAFPAALADEARAILWRDTGCDLRDSSTWTKPVIRLGMYAQPPFVEAASTPTLHTAYDALVGAGRWEPVRAMGTFPVRFPSPLDPGDAGWHIDVSLGFENPDFMEWRANVMSDGRALLMLFLFSDVGVDDAPTRIRVGSHSIVAKQLWPFGKAGLSLRALAANGFDETAHCGEVVATGSAGTVFLCHPFLVHSAQSHRGTVPRFMAQPPLFPSAPLDLEGDAETSSPVARAIIRAIRSPNIEHQNK